MGSVIHSNPDISASHRLESASKHQRCIVSELTKSEAAASVGGAICSTSSPKTKDVSDRRWAFLTLSSIRRILNMKMNNRTIDHVCLLASLPARLSVARVLAREIRGAIVGR
jgi:hypothetical protein